jgi:exonuclease VII large subunit
MPMSPARVLERGYAVVRDGAGAIVRTPADVGLGDHLDIEVVGGRIGARVEEVE